MLTHWLGRDLGSGKHQNYSTIRPVGLDTKLGQWRTLDFPLEYFRYPQSEMKDAIHLAFILTQRLSDSPADASTLVIDDIEIYYEPEPEEWLIRFEGVEDFIDALDLERPELDRVRRAVRFSDYEAAAEAYAQHMRQRRKPVFYLDYRDTDAIMESYTSLYGADDFSGAAFRKKIDELMSGTLAIGEFVGKFPEGPVDWWGESQGLPWTWSAVIQRMQFLPELGKAYLDTGDERYAEKAWHYFDDFNQQWPSGKFDTIIPQFIGWHHGIGVGERTYSLIWAYQFFQRSRSFTPERHIAWQSAIFEHAQWLNSSIGQGFRYTNQQVTEIFGLLAAAVMFPESQHAEEWMKTALDSLLEHMEREVLEDGAYVELVPGYHNWMADLFLKLARL